MNTLQKLSIGFARYFTLGLAPRSIAFNRRMAFRVGWGSQRETPGNLGLAETIAV